MTKTLALCLALALLPLSIGCVDKGDKEDCIGLNCPTGFQWPDGGEVRLWYIGLPDGSELRRFITYFQTGPNDLLPEPGVGLCAPDITGAQIAGREYIDAGESVTYSLNGEQIVVDRLTAQGDEQVEDFFERFHDIVYMAQLDTPVPDSFFSAKSSVTLADPQPFSDKLTGLYMPPKLNVLEPTTAFVELKKGQDVLFRWEEVEPPDPTVVTGAAIVFVPDDLSQPTACISANSGEFVVPGEVIDSFSDDSGIMLIGTAANEAVLTDDGRMIQQWGINCALRPWTRVN